MRRAALAALLLLTGCTTTWRHPDNVPEAQYKADAYECRRDAAMLPKTAQSFGPGVGGSTQYADPTLGWADVAQQKSLFRQCMESRGYVRD